MTINRRTQIRNAAAVVLIGITAGLHGRNTDGKPGGPESTEALERSKNVAFVQCVASREQRSVTCGEQGDPETAGARARGTSFSASRVCMSTSSRTTSTTTPGRVTSRSISP